MKKQNKKLLFVALLGGAAAGAALGVLFSKSSGSSLTTIAKGEHRQMKKVLAGKINNMAEMIDHFKDGLIRKLS